MISERKFAESYKSFWDEHTPQLSFYCSTPAARGKRFGQSIDIPEMSQHVAFNNIIATTHFKNTCINPAYSIERSFKDSIPVIKIFSENYAKSYKLTDDYKEIITIQKERLEWQYTGNIIHDPPFPGYGILYNCKADLLAGSTLVEVKGNTGRRYNKPFENKDFRQLIVYCALNFLSENPYNFQRIHLFNPRMGFLWQSDIEEFIYTITGSSGAELYTRMGDFLLSLSEPGFMTGSFTNDEF